MSKKKNTPVKHYSRHELAQTFNENFGSPETQQIAKELSSRVISGAKLTIAEAEYACLLLKSSRWLSPKIDIESLPACENFVFKALYVEYYDDLDGKFGIDKIYGLASIQQKQIDTQRLDQFYQAWAPLVAKFNHKGDGLLNIVASEANDELKILKEAGIDYRELRTADKSRVLNSKYVYLTAKEFFEEHNADIVIVAYHGSEIEINQESLVHILFRHFGRGGKFYDTGKSFHTDQSLFWKTLPFDLQKILEKIGSFGPMKGVPYDYIPIRYNGKLYTIYTGPDYKHIKGKPIPIVILKTFYPVEDQKELAKINAGFRELKIDESLGVFKNI